MKEYPILENNGFTALLAVSDTEVGKILHAKIQFVGQQTGEILPFPFQKSIESQIDLLKYANNINDLMVKFIREEEYLGFKMLVMEKLNPLPFTHFEKNIREQHFADFEQKLKELHQNQFAHGNIKIPRKFTDNVFKHIILTENGIRLVNTEFAVMGKDPSSLNFFYICEREKRDLIDFKHYWLNL